MSTQHILVVEDEEDILELITYNLIKEGFAVTGVATGEEGLDRAISLVPDLIILDLMLPEIDGFEVYRRLKKDSRTQVIPVLMVTAKGDEADIVAGLELGADDYLPKPFSPKVLVARVRAVLRRDRTSGQTTGRVINLNNLLIDQDRHLVSVAGVAIDLTVSEFKILCHLAERPGWVFSREQLVSVIHSDNFAITPRAIDVQIVGLRKKLGALSDLIETVRGRGYRFRDII